MTEVDEVVRSIRDGKLAVLPTDTVYGLVCAASTGSRPPICIGSRAELRSSRRRCCSLRRRGARAIFPSSTTACWRSLRALLPGPYTLVVPNPAAPLRVADRGRPGSIGLRVPVLAGVAASVVERIGAVVATSANLPGGPDPRTLAEVPPEILAGVAAAVDGGELPGTPSTVIDVTGCRAADHPRRRRRPGGSACTRAPGLKV